MHAEIFRGEASWCLPYIWERNKKESKYGNKLAIDDSDRRYVSAKIHSFNFLVDLDVSGNKKKRKVDQKIKGAGWDTWVAQLVKHLTSAQVTIL